MAQYPVQLITMEEAKDQVHEMHDVHTADNDIDLKISMASSIVLDYLKLDDAPDEWLITVSPLVVEPPFNVKAATLLVFGELFMNRESSTANPISQAVQSLLNRRPTLA